MKIEKLYKKVPTQLQLDNLVHFHQKGQYIESEKLARLLTKEFPKHQFSWKVLGISLQQMGKLSEAVSANIKSVKLEPKDAEAHCNLGFSFLELGKLKDAEDSCRKSISLNPDYAGAHNNLGIVLKRLGKLEEAERSFRQAITSNRYFAQAYKNLSTLLHDLCRLEEAEESCKQAIKIKPNYVNAFWNLSFFAKNIRDSELWLDKCLLINPNHSDAVLMKAALRFYQGDRSVYDNLINSNFKEHHYMRSFSWVFDLPKLPELYFNRWHFFDEVVKKSILSRPFYEFGVWNGSSFKYLIKFFEKGYGFDVFTGLPEDWKVGSKIEKAGTYSNEGYIPDVKGGKFVAGKFEETLPIFFSKKNPMASIINFDADLYSSTILALKYSKSVMDKDTILIFDELIMTESWEHDEFKALNEFCSINNYTYEVQAISFLTKQVAVKLIGI